MSSHFLFLLFVQAMQTISTIKLSGKRLLQLINDILDAAKMKQGIMVIKHEKVNKSVTQDEAGHYGDKA